MQYGTKVATRLPLYGNALYFDISPLFTKIFGTKFDTPFLEIVNNVTAKPESEPKNIKKLLVDQIFSTVKWRESLIEMNKTGVKNFIEIGPGKALSGMVKRTLKEVNSFSINSIADIKNFKNGLKK